METIPNWGAALPKAYQSDNSGFNKQTNLPKLFRGIVLGASGSGKSNLIFDFVKKSPNVYSHLHLIARQPDQPLYRYLKDKLDTFCTIYDEETVPSVDDIQKDGLQLVIFDDWSNDQKWCEKHVVPFFIRGRHKGLTTLFLAHAFFKGCPKMVRLNSEILFLLRTPSKTDLRMILKDMPIAGVTVDQLWGYYQMILKQKGQIILLNTIDQTVRYNWKKILHNGME